jgi:hypothetical protein
MKKPRVLIWVALAVMLAPVILFLVRLGNQLTDLLVPEPKAQVVLPPAPGAEERFESAFGWALPEGSNVLHEHSYLTTKGGPRVEEWLVRFPIDYDYTTFGGGQIQWREAPSEALLDQLSPGIAMSGMRPTGTCHTGQTDWPEGFPEIDAVDCETGSLLFVELMHPPK